MLLSWVLIPLMLRQGYGKPKKFIPGMSVESRRWKKSEDLERSLDSRTSSFTTGAEFGGG